jgi:hypothetical protein
LEKYEKYFEIKLPLTYKDVLLNKNDNTHKTMWYDKDIEKGLNKKKEIENKFLNGIDKFYY